MTELKSEFIQWLLSRGFETAEETTDPYCHYDVVGVKDGKQYIFELKNRRNIPSTVFSDSIIEQNKYDWLLPLDEDKNTVYIVNIFPVDRVMYVHHLQDEHRSQPSFCKKTTDWDQTKVHKILISYPHRDNRKFIY